MANVSQGDRCVSECVTEGISLWTVWLCDIELYEIGVFFFLYFILSFVLELGARPDANSNLRIGFTLPDLRKPHSNCSGKCKCDRLYPYCRGQEGDCLPPMK